MKKFVMASMVVASILSCNSAFAQPGDGQVAVPVRVQTPIGSTRTCPTNNTQIIATLSGGPFGAATSLSSTITNSNFQTIANTPPGQPTGTTQQILAFSATGSDPVLGAFTWEWTGAPAALPTTIDANQLGADFPATGRINFPIQATVGGVTYRSVGDLQLINTNLNSFSPFVNATFTLDGAPLGFEDVDNPGTVVFTLDAISATLNN